MNPITIIMMLFERFFFIVDSTELERIKGDARAWYDKIDINDTKSPLSIIKEKCTYWYVKIGLAIAYFIIAKWLMDFLHNVDESVVDNYRNSNLN